MRAAWREPAGTDGTERALVVPSPSAHEDTEDSSRAGRFDSVLDVRGWEDFTTAVQTVLDSPRRVQPLRPAKDPPPRPSRS